jgi:hypothetical protein
MSRLDATRGTVFVVTVWYSDAAGNSQRLPIEAAALGIGGIRERDFLDLSGNPMPFGIAVPEMDGAQVQQVVLSIAYPNGGFEITPPVPFNGDTGFVVWAGPVMALADPAPIGDPMVDPVFVVGRRHTPNPTMAP